LVDDRQLIGSTESLQELKKNQRFIAAEWD